MIWVVLANLESITSKIDKGEGTLGQLINDSDTVEKLNVALDDIGNLQALRLVGSMMYLLKEII